MKFIYGYDTYINDEAHNIEITAWASRDSNGEDEFPISSEDEQVLIFVLPTWEDTMFYIT